MAASEAQQHLDERKPPKGQLHGISRAHKGGLGALDATLILTRQMVIYSDPHIHMGREGDLERHVFLKTSSCDFDTRNLRFELCAMRVLLQESCSKTGNPW